jgi:asparagine N-glycosylation enzyme membrane subunit Stt3
MKIIVIVILGYFVIGFFGTAMLLETSFKKKKPNPFKAETPPLTVPLTVTLFVGFLLLPALGYRRSRKQGTFLHFGPKFWLWTPGSLILAGIVTALITFAFNPSFFAPG